MAHLSFSSYLSSQCHFISDEQTGQLKPEAAMAQLNAAIQYLQEIFKTARSESENLY